MRKRTTLGPLPGKSVVKFVPEATAWYLEPIGGFSNTALLSKLSDDRISPAVKCFDGVSRAFFSVTYAEVQDFEESRKTEDKLHFSVWYKDKFGEVRLYKDDKSYTQRNPSLFRGRQRPLRRSLKTGDGAIAKFPRRRQQPRELP
jgi:hypothetical protein